MNSEIKKRCLGNVTALLRERHSEAQRKTDAAVAAAYEKHPDIKVLSERMQDNMTEFWLFMSSRDADENAFAAFKNKALSLKKERTELLEKYGYTDALFLPLYTCPICSDTGALPEGGICGCYKKALAEEYLKSSDTPSRERCGFDNFKLDYYGENAPTVKKILNYCKSYARGFATAEKRENLLFYGAPGCGKTFLSCCVAFDIINSGFFVLYTTLQDMATAYNDKQFGRDDPDTEIYTECDLLVIDDLGTEFKTAYTETVLYNVINTRINLRLPFIISTNLDADEINERYGGRIASRLIYETVGLPFPAVDVRIESRKLTQKQKDKKNY